LPPKISQIIQLYDHGFFSLNFVVLKVWQFFLKKNTSCFSNVQLKGKKFQQKIVARKVIPKKMLEIK
jgi:hypothetical protein